MCFVVLFYPSALIISLLLSPIWRCLSLTRQSVGRGPVQPAAQCSLQQSLGEGPLHFLEHCCAQFSFVTGKKKTHNKYLLSFISNIEALSKVKIITFCILKQWSLIEKLCRLANHFASLFIYLFIATPEFPLWIIKAYLIQIMATTVFSDTPHHN